MTELYCGEQYDPNTNHLIRLVLEDEENAGLWVCIDDDEGDSIYLEWDDLEREVEKMKEALRPPRELIDRWDAQE